MSVDQVPPFIFVRDRQNNSDLMVFTQAIRYLSQNAQGHTAITFTGGGTQEVIHTIPELAEMLGWSKQDAEQALDRSQKITDERAPEEDPYAVDDTFFDPDRDANADEDAEA